MLIKLNRQNLNNIVFIVFIQKILSLFFFFIIHLLGSTVPSGQGLADIMKTSIWAKSPRKTWTIYLSLIDIDVWVGKRKTTIQTSTDFSLIYDCNFWFHLTLAVIRWARLHFRISDEMKHIYYNKAFINIYKLQIAREVFSINSFLLPLTLAMLCMRTLHILYNIVYYTYYIIHKH